ncbi:hypothetical protein V9T40_008381 [Parthenolecanium corni]|uniref:Mitochondrial GTPase 1 n=1 Tax=Parthenolecanium corni TaxID=536013 RepID=A0AAN9TQH4_9HEMI
MVSKWGTAQKFRQEFIVPDKTVLRWFPGHMAGGIKKIQAKLKSVDCILEVHDARIPISGRNPNFKRDFLGVKPHVLVLNKADLADVNHTPEILQYLETKENIRDVVFTDCKKQTTSAGLNKLVPKILEAISNSNRHNRICNREFGVLIIGVPNVGKSSLINALRSKYLNKAGHAPVGCNPGVTVSVQNRIKISQDPSVFIYDTPGILTPRLPNVYAGLKLAACAAIKDSLVGPVVIADYLLYWCNKNHWDNYLDFFGIQDRCDEIGKLLTEYAIKKNIYLRLRSVEGAAGMVIKPDIDKAADLFIDAFRKGKLGPVTLDVDVLS